MKTNYQKALDLMEEAHYADPIDADILLRKAAIYANLAVADALRDRSYVNFEFTVGERMEKALRSQGIPFNVVAEVFGVSRQTISNWLHGRTQPNKLALEKWAEITDVPYLWLVDGVVPIDWKPRNPN